MRLVPFTIGLMCASLARGGIVSYQGDVWPEAVGFERASTWDVERRLSDGWFRHDVELGIWEPPPYGEYDYYRHDLSSFAGDPFFIEWRMMSDAPNSEVNHQNGAALVTMVGGPVTYHFNIASGLARIVRGVQYPVQYFWIDPAVAHTYRLDVFGGDYFEFLIDGLVVDSGLPEDVFPTSDALMSFGTGYYRAESTSAWDYVRFGTIPEPGTLLLLIPGAAALFARRRYRISVRH